MKKVRKRESLEKSWSLAIPARYLSSLNNRETEVAVQRIRILFQEALARNLNLSVFGGPLLVFGDTGLNDYLDGTTDPVWFIPGWEGAPKVEIVQSLAKWKRVALARFGFQPREGLLVNMIAIRPEEKVDNSHSIYVDQWDWECVITPHERNLAFLKKTVRQIYKAIKDTVLRITADYPEMGVSLPRSVFFVHTEDLEKEYPDLSPKEREAAICKRHKAVFLIGIGAKLTSGRPHESRAPDYDDWTTATHQGRRGLNGDLLVWNPVLENAFELSSMGIRVNAESLMEQLDQAPCRGNVLLPIHLPEYHQRVLAEDLPLTIGGGIGQSRLCMLLLRKAHIGEVQFSVWPEEMRHECHRNNISLR